MGAVNNKKLYSEEEASLLMRVLGNSPKTRIIDFMMDNPLFDFTKKEIMETIGMSKRTLYKELPDLEEHGIIKVSRKIGKAKLYKINMDHQLIISFRDFEMKFSLQEAEKERIRESEQ